MKTMEEAVEHFTTQVENPVFVESYKELLHESAVLALAINIADSPDGLNARILRALCFGILIGIDTQR
jgi:hypothetical protein